MKHDNVIRMMHNIRKEYLYEQKLHYLTFALYSIILLADFLIIIYIQAVHLDGYTWAGIIFLFVLLTIEGKQYLHFQHKAESVDDFYLRGEYEHRTTVSK